MHSLSSPEAPPAKAAHVHLPGGSPLFGRTSSGGLRPDSPTLSLKLPSSMLDQDGSPQSERKLYSNDHSPHSGSDSDRETERSLPGSGLLSPSASEFQPQRGGNAAGATYLGVFGKDASVWNPSVAPQSDWGAGPATQGGLSESQPIKQLQPQTRPRSASRSAPSTPRTFEWGHTMPYSTAPVSPGGAMLSPHGMVSPGRPEDVYYQGMMGQQQLQQQQQQHHHHPGFSVDQLDLVYSAPDAFGTIGDDESGNDTMPKQAEHPSRTLFVRNLANDTDPLALQAEFEQFGPVRSIYANCKYRGFVMISFFDIRHSKAAMLVLNGKKLPGGKKMDVHYALPKQSPGEKESNQGTLVVFNLDTTMTDDDIREVFSQFGEVKDIRSTPNKNTHKFVEFFDVRDAERALLALNRTKVRTKIIKIEVSRPSNRGRRKGMDGLQQQQPPPPMYAYEGGGGQRSPKGMGVGPLSMVSPRHGGGMHGMHQPMYSMQQQQQQHPAHMMGQNGVNYGQPGGYQAYPSMMYGSGVGGSGGGGVPQNGAPGMPMQWHGGYAAEGLPPTSYNTSAKYGSGAYE